MLTQTQKNTMSGQYWNYWNQDVQDRIDRYIEASRKADADIVISGIPEGTPVRIKQISHDFIFGAPGEPSVSGIMSRDLKPKPAFFALDDLINHQWKTNITVVAERAGHTQTFHLK